MKSITITEDHPAWWHAQYLAEQNTEPVVVLSWTRKDWIDANNRNDDEDFVPPTKEEWALLCKQNFEYAQETLNEGVRDGLSDIRNEKAKLSPMDFDAKLLDNLTIKPKEENAETDTTP